MRAAHCSATATAFGTTQRREDQVAGLGVCLRLGRVAALLRFKDEVAAAIEVDDMLIGTNRLSVSALAISRSSRRPKESIGSNHFAGQPVIRPSGSDRIRCP